jgi:valyl-tRNA synthetase
MDSERNAGLRLNEYAESARRFVWNELADWYLESAKARLSTPGADRDVARAVLVHAFDRALRLLHPIVPFITEALWQRLPGRIEGALLTTADWPVVETTHSAAAVRRFELARGTVMALRQIRSDYNIAPGKIIDAVLIAPAGSEAHATLEGEAAVIGRLTRCTVRTVTSAPAEAAAHAVVSADATVAVPLAGLIDVDKECVKLRGELSGLEKQLAALEGRLANPGFTERAPANVVDAERKKRDEWVAKRDLLAERVRALCGG